MVNNGFHPHVWYEESGSELYSNIVMKPHAGIGLPNGWGKQVDRNLFSEEKHRLKNLDSGSDANSLSGAPQFIDPASGDYRVKETSLASKLGFANFAMDRFGVQRPKLKAIARIPELPKPAFASVTPAPQPSSNRRQSYVWLAHVRDIEGQGERSAYGLPDASGILLLKVPASSPEAKAGLAMDDVIVACDGEPVRTVKDLIRYRNKSAGKPLSLTIIRKQTRLTLTVSDPVQVLIEDVGTAEFNSIPLLPARSLLAAKLLSGGAPTNNDPLECLMDGKVTNGYGPVFANGVENGLYKLDLGRVQRIAQVQSFSSGQTRSRQNFVLYGSANDRDPGWDVSDVTKYTPITSVDTRHGAESEFAATKIVRSDGEPIGSFRWLVWAVAPITEQFRENTAFQELQVIPAN